MILTSPLLSGLSGLRHGFATRLGGVSSGPHATLNLGLGVGDDASKVEANRTRFSALAGLESPIAQVQQVHGARVLEVVEQSADALAAEEADALWTRAPRAVGVRTADCAPVLLAACDSDARVHAVAAVHAGWRGAVARILENAISALVHAGFDAQSLRVAIGPTIGPEHFQVGEEVVEAARDSLDGAPPPVRIADDGTSYLDLSSLLDLHLERAGVPPEHVDHVGGCTFAQPSLFFSHRRDHGSTGRHLAAISRVGA